MWQHAVKSGSRCDVRYWHITDVPLALTNVCFEGKNGHDVGVTPFPLMILRGTNGLFAWRFAAGTLRARFLTARYRPLPHGPCGAIGLKPLGGKRKSASIAMGPVGAGIPSVYPKEWRFSANNHISSRPYPLDVVGLSLT